MKSLIILGAIVGFVIGTGFGLAAETPWSTTLWRACIAALVAGLLTRWWTGVWMRGLKESLEQQRHPVRASAAKTASKK